MFNALCFLRLKEFCFLGILYYAVFKYLTHTQNQNNRVNPRIAITETQPLAFGQTWFTFSHFGGIKYFKANPWHPVILSHIHTSICISKKELTYIATVPFLHRVKLKLLKSFSTQLCSEFPNCFSQKYFCNLCVKSYLLKTLIRLVNSSAWNYSMTF